MNGGMFSVNSFIDAKGERRWVVTCERCNADITHALELSVPVFSVRGFTDMIAQNPDIARDVARRLRDMWTASVRERIPMVVDADDVKIDRAPCDLESTLNAHVDSCPRRGP